MLWKLKSDIMCTFRAPNVITPFRFTLFMSYSFMVEHDDSSNNDVQILGNIYTFIFLIGLLLYYHTYILPS